MKVHHICPPKIAAHMMEHEGVTNQMILAQEWTLDVPPFRVPGDTSHVIMDNGAWEREGVYDVDELIALATHHKVDALVLPDVLGDAERTRELVESNVDAAKEAGLVPIAVCQGMTMKELLQDIWFYHDLGLGIVGMASKLMYEQWREWRGPNRLTTLKELASDLDAAGLLVHLLGVMERPQELRVIARTPLLRNICISVDTATPLRWAYFDQGPAWWPMIQIPRWVWENLELQDVGPFVLSQWKRNMELLEAWAAGWDNV